jgi:rod shape-determining protein MreD
LIIVVYAALQRNAIRAIIFGTIAGIAVDALSGGLLGANGFSKTLVAYVVSEIARARLLRQPSSSHSRHSRCLFAR